MYVCMLNGRTVSDPVGEFTYLDNRGGSSVIDYMLVSSDLYPTVIDFEVLPADYSDHFPIEGKFRYTECEIKLFRPISTNKMETRKIRRFSG